MHKKELESALTSGIRNVFKTETQGEGKINLIFGILVFLFSSAICIDDKVTMVMNVVYNESNELMPWYGKILALFFIIVFFVVCILWINYVDRIKEESTENQNNG